MDVKDATRATIERSSDALVGLSHRLHEHPELGFEEERACEWVGGLLSDHGFDVVTGVADLPTALTATYGNGDLVIGICAEYDALPGVGHACGHNVIAAAAVAAGLGLAAVADDIGVTVKVLGTPAEEGGGGKILMLDRGAFAGIHAAMMVHPAPHEQLDPETLAVSHFDVEFHGRDAHASAYPQAGINAADALTVSQVAIGLLRQHIHGSDRIHGIVRHGGDAPNIVPSRTTGSWYVRARTLAELAELQPRVEHCFEAGALATGCSYEITSASPPYSEFDHDAGMCALYRRNAESLGRTFIAADSPEAKAAGSTDMANVSLAMPTIQPMIAIESDGSSNHQPEFAQHCARPSADKAILDGGIAMAWTVVDLAGDGAERTRLLTRTAS
ncbi:MAG: M20 family metallopeptidase [Frankiaceae bacterium]